MTVCVDDHLCLLQLCRYFSLNTSQVRCTSGAGAACARCQHLGRSAQGSCSADHGDQRLASLHGHASRLTARLGVSRLSRGRGVTPCPLAIDAYINLYIGLISSFSRSSPSPRLLLDPSQRRKFPNSSSASATGSPSLLKSGIADLATVGS